MLFDKKVRLIVAGSRGWPDTYIVYGCLDILLSKTTLSKVTILSGHCPNSEEDVLDSPDIMGEIYAQRHGLDLEMYPANWKRYGKRAGRVRNKKMARLATHLAAFWDGESRGTQNMISTARKNGLIVAVIDIKGNIRR